MTETSRIFTPVQIVEAAQEALDNWDFDVEIDNGRSPKFVKAMKEALTFNEDYARSLWGEEMDLDSAFSDIWDFLDEFARNMTDSTI